MKKTIKLTEADLTKLVHESVKTVLREMNEISSDTIVRTMNKFHQKYGGTDFPGPDAKDFPKDENGNLLYPKDMKPLAQHYKNFRDAYIKTKAEELDANSPAGEAKRIWQEHSGEVEWEVADKDWFRDEGGHGTVIGHLQTEDGWKFEAEGYGYYQGGDLGDIEVESVEFTTPDGQTGSLNL